MVDEDYEFIFKVLLVGSSSVGKTCLLLRGATNEFVDQHHLTIGVDFKSVTINIDGRVIKLQVWDTAGQERFHAITTAFYMGAYGILIVYDVTDRESFEKCKSYWYPEAMRHSSPNTKLLLVGNKSDLIADRKVTLEEGSALAASLQIPFLETSAKDNVNISEMFNKLCREILGDKYITTQIQLRASQAMLPVPSRSLPEWQHKGHQSSCCSGAWS